MSKISISHYLNKKLKPKVEQAKELYPIYIRVTYKSKNLRFKSHLVPFCENENDLNKYLNKIQVEKEIIEFYINSRNDLGLKSTDLTFALFSLATPFSQTFLFDNNQIIYDLDKEINQYLEKSTIFSFSQIYLIRSSKTDTNTISPIFLRNLDVSFITNPKLKLTIENYKNLLELELKKDLVICPYTFKMYDNINLYVRNKLNNKDLLVEIESYTSQLFNQLHDFDK